MAKLTMTGDAKDNKDRLNGPLTLEVETLPDLGIRVTLCQGDMHVDLPMVKHVELDSSMPDQFGHVSASIQFGNGELKWIVPEPVIKE